MAATRPTAEILDRPPGHARILGAPRSGKTSLLIERFHHLERAGHHPLVIAFGREQSDRLIERLIPAGAARFGAMPVTTHGMLATRIISTARPRGARTLRDVDELVVLDRVMETHALTSDLRSIADSRALRDTLLPLLHLFAQNGITGEEAERAATLARDPRARDVVRLFAAYRRYLDEHSLITFYDAAWVAARAVTADASLTGAIGADVILVDDFQDLDAGQFELLRALAPPGGIVAIEAFGDPAGARFSFRGTSARFLQEVFPRTYEPEDFHLPAPRPTDAALASTIDALYTEVIAPARSTPSTFDGLPLFRDSPQKDAALPDVHSWNVRVTAVRASDEIAEMQSAAIRVKAWLDSGMSPAEIAVIARDPDRVASLAHQVFREFGVSIDTGTRGDTAVEAFVHALVGALGRDTDGRFADALESSSLVASFCSASNETPRHLPRFVSSLRAGYAGRGAFDLVRLLEERVAPAVSRADRAAIDEIGEEWRRYCEVITHTGGHASLDEFRRAYLDGSERGPGTNRVPLVSARAASGRSARAVIVTGCAEGVFPRIEIEGGYISLADLARAMEPINAGVAADLEARTDRDARVREETRLLHSALCAGSEQLVVSYPARHAGQHATPAGVLGALFTSAQDAGRVITPPMRAATVLSLRVPDDALASRLRAMDSLASRWIAAAPAALHPSLESCRLSPSALETFSRCERKFLYSKVLRIDEPGSIYMEIGNVFHGVMKRIIRKGADGDEVRAVLRSGEYAAAFDEAVAEDMVDASDWVKELTRVSIGRMLLAAAELEAERRGRYTVRSVEQLATYPPEGETVLSGRLDRVDLVEGIGPVVVDYKTGQMKRTAATLIKELVEDRRHWQVPLYSALAADEDSQPVAFLFYIVPPDGEPKIVGMQIVDGKLPPPIPDGGKSKSPYGVLGAATVHARLQEAITLRAALMNGEAEFQRTEPGQECERCHFIRVCRRNQA